MKMNIALFQLFLMMGFVPLFYRWYDVVYGEV